MHSPILSSASTVRYCCHVTWIIALAACVLPAAGQSKAPAHELPPVGLVLPTENKALFSGDRSAFYQYTDRPIKPGFDKPWMGGRYGFVRNGIQTRWGILYPRFHEGIDIKPLARTARGEPLDEVRSIADGVIVHVNRTSSRSSYGQYVVVEHWWRGSPYYSLSAHLNKVYVEVGQPVSQGEPVGLLGYTGVGLNRRRAHVHLEINLLLNRHFQQCYDRHFPDDPNHHGLFNGINLAGVDVAELYLRLAEDATYTVRRLVEDTPGFFRVTVPANGMLDILWRYPWLSPQLRGWLPDFGTPADLAASWTITFSRSGLPVRIEAEDQHMEGSVLEVLETTEIPYRYLTNGLVGGSGDDPVLTRRGQRLVDFLTCSPPDPPEFSWQ